MRIVGRLRVGALAGAVCAAGLGVPGVAAMPPQAPGSSPPAAPPSGRADVFSAPATLAGVGDTVGTTFTVEVRVEPRNVEVDAAAAYVTFDAGYLEVAPGGLIGGAVLDTEIARRVDGGAGTIFYAAGKLAGAGRRPDTEFVLAQITFRLKAAPPGPLAIDLVQRDAASRRLTDVAADGLSILNATRGTQVTFGAPPVSGGSSGSGGRGGGGASSSGRTSGSPSSPSPTSSGAAGASGVPQAPAPPPPPAVAGVAVARPPAASNPGPGPLPPGGVPPLPPSVQVGRAPVGVPFELFYAERQGLRVLGNTLGAPRLEGGILGQYFEKGRLEGHPEEPEPLWRFQYGLLADELVAAGALLPVGGDASTLTYAAIQQLAQPAARLAPPAEFAGGTLTLPDGAVFVPFSAALLPEPGHVIPAVFWLYLTDLDLFPSGWLHDVGLPIMEPVEAVVDKGPDRGRRIVVQAYQRTVLTLDALNPEGWQVERANVGTDYARAFPSKFDE